mgnify:FL=1
MKILKSKELKSFREELLKAQNYTDPITLEYLSLESSVLDHSHISHNIRKVLDRNTNQFEGKVFGAYRRFIQYKSLLISLSGILRNLADYYEKDYSNNPYHPLFIKSMVSKFKRLKVQEQILVLKEAKIQPGKNLKIRSQQYKKLINENS